MQHGGSPRKVKLKVDLTKYDSRCKVNEQGYTVPNAKANSGIGGLDQFVAVKFDNGAFLDVVYNSLEFEDEKVLK